MTGYPKSGREMGKGKDFIIKEHPDKRKTKDLWPHGPPRQKNRKDVRGKGERSSQQKEMAKGKGNEFIMHDCEKNKGEKESYS